MNMAHDMGGDYCREALEAESCDSLAFSETWHARALALTLAAGFLGYWNLDESRRYREQLAEGDYLKYSYYERWIAALVNLLVQKGLVSLEDLRDIDQRGRAAPHPRMVRPDDVARILAAGSPAGRSGDLRDAKFHEGDIVRLKSPGRNRFVTGGHTRLPVYVQGCTGRILRSHGRHLLPDSNAHGLGEQPEHLYTVAVSAIQIWGADAEDERDEINLDLWEGYLE